MALRATSSRHATGETHTNRRPPFGHCPRKGVGDCGIPERTSAHDRQAYDTRTATRYDDHMPPAEHETPTSRRPRMTVVIPAYNERRAIVSTIAAARSAGVEDILIVDGGSDDATVDLARNAGARVIDSRVRGRGAQCHAGAAASAGEIIWFLHADTIVPDGSLDAIDAAMRQPDVIGGHFRVRFDGKTRAARRLTPVYRWLAIFGIRYGDSAYFVRRSAYERAGGFRDLPIFEDVDLLRRLRREGRFVRVHAEVLTSSRRFEGRCFALVFARWMVMQILFWLSVHPRRLARGYRPIRSDAKTVQRSRSSTDPS